MLTALLEIPNMIKNMLLPIPGQLDLLKFYSDPGKLTLQ